MSDSSLRLYPIRFKPIMKEKIWGARRLGSFLRKRLPAEKKFGESWGLVDRENEVSVIDNGWYEGETIRELIQKSPERILGEDVSLDQFGRFPLLAKFIDAEEDLSIQVHPPDDYAQLKENDSGKIEAWYILEADEDARVIRGVLPDVGPEELVEAIREDRPLDVLNSVSVSPGDVVMVPPGIVHSIGGGVLFFEIQKNSDVTYRLYDWNRITPEGKSRPLHHERALDVIDFEAMGRTRARPKEEEGPGDKRLLLVRTSEFKLWKLNLSSEIEEDTGQETFQIMVCTEGSGQFRFGENNGLKFGYSRGEFFLIPSGLKTVRIKPEGPTEFLKVTP